MKQSALTFHSETFAPVQPEIAELCKEHYEEVVSDKELFRLNPLWTVYQNLAENGVLKTYTARDNGQLAGYILMLVMPAMHYSDTLVAKDSAHFLRKPYRRGLEALRFFAYVEDEVKKLGVQVLMFHTKCGEPSRASVFEFMKFTSHEEIFMKKLGG